MDPPSSPSQLNTGVSMEGVHPTESLSLSQGILPETGG